jgi:hypothetical protein
MNSRPATLMVNNQVALVGMVNPGARSDNIDVPFGYDGWQFYFSLNLFLNKAQQIDELFAFQPVTISRDDTSQPFNVPLDKRFIESISQERREEPLPQAVSRLNDPSNAQHDASNAMLTRM